VKRTLPALVLAGVVLVAAGCGSSSKTSAKTTEATQSTSSSTSDKTSSSTSSSDGKTSTDVNVSGLSGKCKDLAESTIKYQKALAATGNFAAGGDMGKQFATVAAAFEDFANQAPSEIKADLKVMADSFAQAAEAMKGVTFKPGQQPSAANLAKLTKLGQSLNGAKLRQASAHLTAWTQKNCGGTP